MSQTRTGREIPIVMDAGALSDAARKHADDHAHDHAHGHGHDHAGHHADDPSAPVPGPAPVWLRVGDIEISEADIAREMPMHRADSPHHAREDAARTLVVRALVRLECARLGIEARPEDGETEDEALVRQLIDREVDSPMPDEDAVRRFYEANRERLHHPDRIGISHILLAAPPSDVRARGEARDRAESLIAALKADPGRFEAFAAEHSACPSREQGGSLGWIERGDTVPEFERQVFMLREGLAGLGLETRYGYHVVRVDGIVRGAPLSWPEALPRVAAYLETQARQNALQGYLEHLRERYPVEGWEQIATVD